MTKDWNTEPLGVTFLQYQYSLTQLGICKWAVTQEHLPSCHLSFSIRSLQLKYPFIWDIETVFHFRRKLPENNWLSDKLLTLKVSMMLTLLSASKVSEVTNLTVDFLTKCRAVHKFCVPHLTKTPPI